MLMRHICEMLSLRDDRLPAILIALGVILAGWVGPSRTQAQAGITPRAYLPLIATSNQGCQPVPGQSYGSLTVNPPPLGSPAAANPDFNLAVRGYAPTTGHLGLVTYGGPSDPRAPQLPGLFTDRRTAIFAAIFRVHDWDWPCNCLGPLLSNPPVTYADLGTTPGEVIHVPDSGYDIGEGYDVLVLYASHQRLTLKYTREDHVVYGYTLHLENLCVEPGLLDLYRTWDRAGRQKLPALRGGQAVGRALGNSIGVAIRDTGTFLDPRSRKDWWQGR